MSLHRMSRGQAISTRKIALLSVGVTVAILIALWAVGLIGSGGPKFLYFNNRY